MYAYTGSFTTAKRKAHGDGIHVYRIDPETGNWTHVQHVGDLTNPSFLALGPDQRFVYSVHGDGEHATAFARDCKTGRLGLLNRAATGGSNGVRQAIDVSGRLMVVANYASGTIAVLAIDGDGALRDQHQVLQLPGEPGPHRSEQTSSHPHDVVIDPSGRFVLVPDKGLDRVFVFHLDAVGRRLAPTDAGSMAARPGAGPRHLAFHPRLPVVWVLNELDSTVATCGWDGVRGELAPRHIIATLPSEFVGRSSASEIAVAPDGRFVYCSNRGHDSIAIFRAHATEGTLTPVGWQSTQGSTPRFIGLDPPGRRLYAANEAGHTIVAFRIAADTGALSPTGQVIANASPVSIVFAGA
jgi:6-phosphogluconolactonase (cycloisomerase 2 family)